MAAMPAGSREVPGVAPPEETELSLAGDVPRDPPLHGSGCDSVSDHDEDRWRLGHVLDRTSGAAGVPEDSIGKVAWDSVGRSTCELPTASTGEDEREPDRKPRAGADGAMRARGASEGTLAGTSTELTEAPEAIMLAPLGDCGATVDEPVGRLASTAMDPP